MERHGNQRKDSVIKWLKRAAGLDVAGFLLLGVGITREALQDPYYYDFRWDFMRMAEVISIPALGLSACIFAFMALLRPTKRPAIASSLLLVAQPVAFLASVLFLYSFDVGILCSTFFCFDNFLLELAVYILIASALVLLVTVSAQVWGWWQSRKTRQA